VLIASALRLLWRPEQTWDAVRSAAPGWRRSLSAIVAPLALIPAVSSWPSSGSAYAFCVATVLVAAAAIYALAPVFSAERNWDGAVSVASYSSVPVLLASPLLASATLTILVVLAFFHACFLCGIGLRRVLGCRGEDAAMYVAAVGFVSGVAGLVLGGLSSAAGIL
jgi:hypothetical protein